MANTSSECAMENMAYEADDKCTDGVADTDPGVHSADEKQNRVFVVPLPRHLLEDEKGQLTEGTKISECLEGNNSITLRNDEIDNQPSSSSANKVERAGTTNSIKDIEIECSPVQVDYSVAKSKANKQSHKGTLLHFSNKAFEDDVLTQQQETETGLLKKDQKMAAMGKRQRRRRIITNKLKSVCIHFHFKCLGITLVCLIILALFVVPPSTTW